MRILCLTILAFADASYAVSNAITDPTKRYFAAYWQALLRSYLIALGDFNYGAYNDSGQAVLSWLFFLLATLVNCVVMLNLLIAVVSETFADVLGTKVENTFKERAAIISANYFLLSQG